MKAVSYVSADTLPGTISASPRKLTVARPWVNEPQQTPSFLNQFFLRQRLNKFAAFVFAELTESDWTGHRDIRGNGVVEEDHQTLASRFELGAVSIRERIWFK